MGRESIKTSGAAASATRRGAPGRRIAHTIAAALFGCTVLAAAAAPAESEPRAANGLIVELKDAPAHERAQALGIVRLDDAGGQRLQRVLGNAGISRYHAQPAGRAAQRLDFGRVLDGAEAARIAAQLRADPDVE